MRYSDAFKSNYIKSADLRGKPRTYTIASVTMEEVGDEQKPVMRFEESDQGLVLNKTNGSTLKDSYGEDMDDWIGRKIQLQLDKTQFAGKRVDCTRVQVPAAEQTKGPGEY